MPKAVEKTKKLRIMFLVTKFNRKRIVGWQTNQLSLCVNNNLSVFNLEDLNENLLEKINREYDAVFMRPAFNNSLVKKIKKPVLIQHELPLNIYKFLDQDVCVITDKSLLEFCPNGSSATTSVISNFTKMMEWTNRPYDMLVLGRYVKNKNEGNSLIKLLFGKNIESSIDKVVSVPEFMKQINSTNIFFGTFFYMSKMLNFLHIYYKILWHLCHLLRNKRRDIIFDDAISYSNSGKKLCIITDVNGAKRIKQNKNIDVFSDPSVSKICELMEKTKYVVVQTPMHTSILNERFTLAISNGSIPIIDSYPQYKAITGSLNKELVYNYRERKPSKVINRLGSSPSNKKIIAELRLNYKKRFPRDYIKKEFEFLLDTILENKVK